jgi:hypothetical protein
MITFIILSVLFLGTTIYFAYRAYVLAGVLADQEEYYETVSDTNQYMYNKIQQSYTVMQRIDRLGAFEKDDEAGTTFELLNDVIEKLKEEFDAEEEEEK